MPVIDDTPHRGGGEPLHRGRVVTGVNNERTTHCLKTMEGDAPSQLSFGVCGVKRGQF